MEKKSTALYVYVHTPVCMCGWLHPGSSIIFSLPHSPLGFHQLRLSDGEKQAELGTVDSDETPVVMLGPF